MLGPFVDDTDGKTLETGLTIEDTDIYLSKNGGAFANPNDTANAAHSSNGYYTKQINGTDTGTLGILTVECHESGALPIRQDYQVVTANWWDTMCSTDQLDVNVTNIEGSDATDQINAACDTAFTDYDPPTKTEMDTAHSTTDGKIDALNDLSSADVTTACTSSLNTYDPPTKAELDTAVADVSVDEIQATALADLFNTDSGTTYAAAVAGSPVKETADNAGGSALTEAGIADAVWDEAMTGHVTAGTFGLLQCMLGKWEIDTNQLKLYDLGGNLKYTFNLTRDDNATEFNPAKREAA